MHLENRFCVNLLVYLVWKIMRWSKEMCAVVLVFGPHSSKSWISPNSQRIYFHRLSNICNISQMACVWCQKDKDHSEKCDLYRNSIQGLSFEPIFFTWKSFFCLIIWSFCTLYAFACKYPSSLLTPVCMQPPGLFTAPVVTCTRGLNIQ